MPQREGNVMDQLFSSGGGGDEVNILQVLYDTKNYQRLKMISEIPPDLIFGTTVLGVIQKRFNSKVLKSVDVEFLSRQKSKDRKGILELVELYVGLRRGLEGEPSD
jgi:hypothetical protein